MQIVESSKHRAVSSMEQFLHNFFHVPDDRLDWAPAPSAKSALRIGAHTALYAGRFAQMVRDRRLPAPEDLPGWLAQREAEERAVMTRQEVEQKFREGTAQLLEALDSLKPEEIESSLETGQGFSMTMKELLDLPGYHAAVHTGQIDYLQTCWNDQQVYVRRT